MKLKKAKSDQDDATPVPPQAEIIEADLYKRTWFGPDVQTLDLECWEEELSEVQQQKYKNADDEYKSIQTKLDEMVKDTGGEIVYNGDQFTAYQLLGKQPALKDLERQSADIIRSRSRSMSISKEPKQTRRGRPRKIREEDRDYTPSPDRAKSPEVRHKKKKKDKEKEKEKDKSKEEKKEKEPTKTKDKTLAPSNVHSVVTNVRPSESSAVGGLLTGTTKTTAVVDLTKEDGVNKNVADSREVSFNKLQGKTFPSLVVVARPYLRARDGAPPADRAALDAKVKAVLMHTPMKFTEWLIQQGLVRSDQWCAIHPETKLKLGMYSDASKFPYSGGYVWISECCPTRFVSVFYGSIFEGATFPPSVILKLIYHWACQTNVQNVVQWVKVDNLYVKGLFTWLRAICTSATHQHMGLLGGSGKKVEVGVISLGTTSHDGTQRQVKVEVLGVLDPVEKVIRLRAVEPLAEQEKNYKKRFQKILEPLNSWVNPSSTILTDLTVDKGTLIQMGFKNVHQTASQEQGAKNSNANIMEYLRRIVPRMFQNTLSLLSRQIIQQFLDELVWRERFGVSPGQAFDNIVEHIAEQTRLESKENITVRLIKISTNPFKNWKYSKIIKGKDEPSTSTEPETGRGKRGRKRKEPTPPPPPPPPRKKRKERTTYVEDDEDEEVILLQDPEYIPDSPLLIPRTKSYSRPRKQFSINLIKAKSLPLALRLTKVKKEKEKAKDTIKETKDTKKETKDIKKETKDTKKETKDTKKETKVTNKDTKDTTIETSTPTARGGRVRKTKTYTIDVDDDVPLKSIKKEVKPEETVSMEKYYYGQVKGSEEKKRVAIAVECPICRVEINNNIELMRHLFLHVSPSVGAETDHQCVFCLIRFATDEELQTHLKYNHPSDTKSPDVFTYACLICEVRFAAVLTLASHMQKSHAPLELPYTCFACGYRGSSHRRTIEHFALEHQHDDHVQCPHCLKVVKVYADGCELTANVLLFIDHLKQHLDKELELKCSRCVLRFVHLGQMTEHQVREHNPLEEALPLCSGEHLINKPKNKARPPVKDSTSHTVSDSYEELTLALPDGMLCRECDTPLDSDNHFLGTTLCSKCPYVTSCYRGMLRHSGYCAGPHSLEDAPRNAPHHAYCVCGYNTIIGTDMLTHLLICEHQTAYSSEGEARANTVRGETTSEERTTSKAVDEGNETVDSVATISDYAPPSVLNTQLSLDDLAPPSVLQTDQHEELIKDAYDRPLATPRREEPHYTLGDFEPLPQEPPPQPDFEQL